MNEVIEIKLRNCRTNEKSVITAYSRNHSNQLLRIALKILVTFGE